MSPTVHRARSTGYELRYESLFRAGRGYAFPCDASGRVLLDAMGERARTAYRSVDALVGREYAMPTVLRSDFH